MSAILLGPDMTIYNAAALREQLAAAVTEGALIELDLADVAEIDSSGLQLLLAARKSARARGATLRLVRRSAAVDDALALLALDTLFAAPAPTEGGQA
jgi:anti-sigma B factor antagonist